MLFKEIIAIYSEIHTKHLHKSGQTSELMTAEARGTYSYHQASNY
jgi:hypothetical protein